ncbi:MAG: YceI family protein [Armatimonadetes bacterium]|nr:YceI family protein [Armatimonadota bacterium]
MSVLIASLALHAISPMALAENKTFDFSRPNLAPQQVVVFESNTALEDIVGRTNKVKGSISGDVAKRSGTGKISIDLASLNSGVDLRDEHMRSEGWLNVAKYPTAEFQTSAVKFVGGNNFDVTGKFSLHGVTKTIKTRAVIKYMPESDLTKRNHFDGDVIQVKTKFDIKLSDYGIKIMDIAKDKVSNSISISVSVVGTTK